MYSNIDVKPVENFWENDQQLQFFLPILGQKQNKTHTHIHTQNIRPMRPIFYTPLKVVPMGMQSKIEVNSDKIIENLNLDIFGGPKWHGNLGLWGLSFHTSKSSCNGLKIKFRVNVNPVETLPENSRKPTFWPILAEFRFKKGPKIWPTGAIFSHTHLKVSTECLKNKFHGRTFKNFLRKWWKKNLQKSQFWHIFDN